MQETLVQSLGQEDLLEKEMATHSSILAWRTPWMEAPGGLHSPWGRKESDTTERLHFCFLQCMKVKSESEVTQFCLTLCNPMDCTPPGSSVHGISKARILEWVAISFSMESSWPRDWTQVSCIAGRFFTIWATREGWTVRNNLKYWFSITICF